MEVKEAIEKKKKKAGELDTPMKVTLAHVASVCSEVYGSRLSSTSSTTANSFPLQQKLVICSLMVCLRDKKVKEVATGKVIFILMGISFFFFYRNILHEIINNLFSYLSLINTFYMLKLSLKNVQALKYFTFFFQLHEVYSRVCKSRHVAGITNEEMSSACTLLESQGIISIKKTKDKRNDKVCFNIIKYC